MLRLIAFLALIIIPTSLFAELTSAQRAKINLESCTSSYLNKEPIAFNVCMPLAKDRIADAQFAIANMYYWGWYDYAVRNYKKAIFWYKRSAVLGNREAKYHLGVLYEKGLGADINYGKAFIWYLSAAKNNYAPAQLNIANMYAKGAGVKANQYEAVKWYSRAARQGEINSQYNYANRLAKGNGIVQNIVEAYKWYMIAENAGDIDAAKTRLILEGELTEPEKIRVMKEVKAWRPVLQ